MAKRTFKQFVESFFGKGRRSRIKVYAVDNESRKTPLKGQGVFFDLGDGSGIFISNRKSPDNTIVMVSWPDNKNTPRFITKACCSHVLAVGLETAASQ